MKLLPSYRWMVGLVCGVLLAGWNPARSQTHGYGFVGGTFIDRSQDAAFRYGIGGAAAVAPHWTLGGEVGALRNGYSGIIVSGNVGFHFRRSRESGLDPFVTGGVTGVRTGGETGLYGNLGLGSNYWFHDRVGVRGEFRAYPGGQDMRSFWEVRFGVCFR